MPPSRGSATLPTVFLQDGFDPRHAAGRGGHAPHTHRNQDGAANFLRRGSGLQRQCGVGPHAGTARVLADIGITLKAVITPTSRLSGGEKQAVAITRAVKWARRLIFMDEPTAAFGDCPVGDRPRNYQEDPTSLASAAIP